jgi:hypothetical protein
MIYIENKKKNLSKLQQIYPHAIIVDVTSKSTTDFVKLSPFYPHGDIPVPFSTCKSYSVEGIWQGLKVFENIGIDIKAFDNCSMKNIKRTVRKYGQVLGHQKGIKSDVLLDYLTARMEIYIPTYLWVIENKLKNIILNLIEISKTNDLVLLDYETNTNILNTQKPLSHAYLIKAYIEGNYPCCPKYVLKSLVLCLELANSVL